MRLRGRKKKATKVGSLRRSQLITTYGCGAIVDLPRESVIVAGTDFWQHKDNDEYRITEENLQSLLGVDYFISPPGNIDETGWPAGLGIPAFRFPTWMYCPECKRLAPLSKFDLKKHPKCQKCGWHLVPSRFVVACENGHLDDFPYEWWLRRGKKCPDGKQPELFIEMSGESAGLESIIIKCFRCGSDSPCIKSMAGSFGAESLKGFKCTRRRPWLNDYDPAECDKPMRTILRGATNLHFSINVSALSIPPWSKRLQIELGKKWTYLKPLLDDRETFEKVVKAWKMPEQFGCSATEMWKQAKLKGERESMPRVKSWQEMLAGEYRAFLTDFTDEDDEFKTRDEEVPELVKGYIDRVILALRLREVMALRGFKRIVPEYDFEDSSSFTGLSRDAQNWLPAVELTGEGIFILLNEEKLQKWETKKSVESRYRHLIAGKTPILIRGTGLSPRYVLLHTLSHLLIRQLILQCGYSSASIKERIYCNPSNDEHSSGMGGILLYTATNDSEGSLGGLVREGRNDRLDNTFRQMLEAASWCSADPLCIQSSGQGLQALNLAACHSCTLLPETSCEARNCYLDRAAVVGTLDDGSIGFFNPLLRAGEL